MTHRDAHGQARETYNTKRPDIDNGWENTRDEDLLDSANQEAERQFHEK